MARIIGVRSNGTATPALSVSHIVDTYADGDPTRVTRQGGLFTSMVLMPSTITVECKIQGDVVSYQLRAEQGDLAISSGFVCLAAG